MVVIKRYSKSDSPRRKQGSTLVQLPGDPKNILFIQQPVHKTGRDQDIFEQVPVFPFR